MYINNISTLANINPNSTDGWVPMLRRLGSIAVQINLPATGAPIGTFIFETTDDVNPFVVQGVILGAVLVPLVGTYAGATFQPTDGAARLVNFDFGPSQPVPCPTGRFFRMRYARTSGGSATGFFADIAQRGV